MDFIADALWQFSPGRLFEDPGPAESGLYINLLFVLASTLTLGLLLALRPHLLVGGDSLKSQLMRSYGSWLAWISATGIGVILLRFSGAPFFSKRIWTLAIILGLLALGIHFLRYRLTTYPHDRAQLEKEQLQRHFRTGPPPPARRRPRKR